MTGGSLLPGDPKGLQRLSERRSLQLLPREPPAKAPKSRVEASGTRRDIQVFGHQNAGPPEEAKGQFEKALEVDPFDAPAEGCLNVIEDVIGRKINSQVTIHLFRAVDYGNKGMFDDALAEFTKAITIDPDYALSYC